MTIAAHIDNWLLMGVDAHVDNRLRMLITAPSINGFIAIPHLYDQRQPLCTSLLLEYPLLPDCYFHLLAA